MKKNSLIYYLKWGSVIIISLSIIAAAIMFRTQLSHFRSLGLLGIFLANLLASSTIFFPAPGIATVVAGGAVYPPILVGILAALGASLGDMLGYLFGSAGKNVLYRNHGKRYERLMKLFEKYVDVVIFIFAFVPNPLFDGVGILAGALKYPLPKFFALLFAGRLLRNLALAYFGLALDYL